MTEQANALQLLQFRESIFYALLNYLRHEDRTLTSRQPPNLSPHAQKEPSFYPGDSTLWLSRADVMRARSPASSASAASAAGEDPSGPCGRGHLPVADCGVAARTPPSQEDSRGQERRGGAKCARLDVGGGRKKRFWVWRGLPEGGEVCFLQDAVFVYSVAIPRPSFPTPPTKRKQKGKDNRGYRVIIVNTSKVSNEKS